MVNIGIIGYGYVGEAVKYGFLGKRNNILFHDSDERKKSNSLEEVVDSSEFIFICVPTPYIGDNPDDYRIDLSIINKVVKNVSNLSSNSGKILIIKSTVIPGTTLGYAEKYPDNLFCFNPEFLTEANHLKDFVNADRIVIGVDHKNVGEKVEALYKIEFPKTPIIKMGLIEAELTKYAANSFLATKIIFANEIYDLCERMGIDYGKVREGLSSDRRIGNSHLEVTKERGYGGKCFPKDIFSLIHFFKTSGIDASLLRTVSEKNLRIRHDRDWENIPFVNSSKK